MYVQHPYKFEGKYYAKIDGVYYEISKEVAMAMFADYRNEIYRSRKWAPDYREEDLQMEELQDLKIVFCKPFLVLPHLLVSNQRYDTST